MPYARVRGVALHYDASGPRDGPVVALLHGAFRTASDWARHRATLAKEGYRVIALDDRGHGKSTRFGAEAPWESFAMETFVEDARAWLDAVAPRGPVHLVGHSRGATVASWLATELGHPRVASLVLAASPPQASEAFRAFFRRIADRPDRPRGYEGELAAATDRYLASIPDGAFPAESLSLYRGPALVLEAGRDPLYSPTHTMFWRAWLKSARVERIDDGGHAFPFDGGEGEAWFRARVLAHLAEVARLA